jgi:putative two-component system response regulator
MKKTILVVDDSPQSLLIVAELLSEFTLKIATGAEFAFKIIDSGIPIDLILLDIVMPKMDGFELAGRLKMNPATANIPIIFLTADRDVKNFIRGFDLGAEDYIMKPIEPKEVLHAVYAALQHDVTGKGSSVV